MFVSTLIHQKKGVERMNHYNEIDAFVPARLDTNDVNLDRLLKRRIVVY